MTELADEEIEYPQLRSIGQTLRNRLSRAQWRHQLPTSPWKNRKRQVVYELFVHLDRASGEVKVNVAVEGLGHAIPAAADPELAAEWMATGGADLVARIDRILGRDGLGVGGHTRLVLPEAS